MPVCKMFEIGSEQWMEWLAHVELGVYGNVYDERQGFIQSSQYQADYDGDDGPMESSSWEIWPYNSRDEENPVSDISKFHLMLRLEGIDVSDGIGTEDYSYTWKVHYKTVGSDDAYRMIEFAPWRSVSLGDGAIYTSDLMGRGMEKPEVGDTFHMVFFIYDGDGELVGWTSRLVDWTDSSEAYYQDALKYGLI